MPGADAAADPAPARGADEGADAAAVPGARTPGGGDGGHQEEGGCLGHGAGGGWGSSKGE